MTKEKIVFPKKSVNFLVKQIINKIDYQKLAEIAANLVPKPKDGRDGESLLLTEAIRADVINAAARLIPPPKDGKDGEPGSDYTLTRADQQEIVDIIKSAIKIPTVDDLTNTISDTFVSRSVFKNNVARIKQMISEAKGKRGATAGISGGEMVAEIDRAIGTDWRTTPEIIVNKGLQDGFVVKYDTSTRVIITAGRYEVDGSEFILAADTTHDMTSLATIFDHHYVYLDKSESALTVPVFYDETTEPGFDPVKRGWYHPTNTEDRIVGVIQSPAASATIDTFDTWVIYGRLIRNSANRHALGLSQNPDPTWASPNIAECSGFVPVNAVEVNIQQQNSDGGANTDFAWRNNEGAALNTVYFQSMNFYGGFGFAIGASWGALGASRNIKVAGNGDDDNALFTSVKGYGYSR